MFTSAGVKIDSEGNVWVVDRGNSRVQKFTRDGEFLTAWGDAGDDQGQIGAPTRIAFDNDGNFYVSKVQNSRVQIFSSEGEYISDLASASLSNAHGWAFDSNGDLYVADTGNNFI